MKNILPAMAVVLAIGFSAWYFTTQNQAIADSPVPPPYPTATQTPLKAPYKTEGPNGPNDPEDQGNMIAILFQRLVDVEQKCGVTPRKELDVLEMQQNTGKK